MPRKKDKQDEGRPSDPHAVELGRKGGKARAAKLSKKERSEQARKAAEARWEKEKGRPPER